MIRLDLIDVLCVLFFGLCFVGVIFCAGFWVGQEIATLRAHAESLEAYIRANARVEAMSRKRDEEFPDDYDYKEV